MAIFDLRGTELGKSRETIDDYREIGGRLIGLAARLMASLNLDEGRLNGICIGVPALMGPERETIISSTVLPIALGNDFIVALRRRFRGVVVQLENESILSAYAEMEFSSLSGIRDLLYIDIDTGIGAGIVMDGHPYRGFSGMAGEIGHVSIDIDGPPCPCGNRGCVEQMANVPALIRMVVQMIESGGNSPCLGGSGEKPCQIDFVSLCRAAEQQDPLVLEAIGEISRRLASGINSVLNILNPQAVVIGGAMADLGDTLFDRLEGHLSEIALQPCLGTRRIRRSSVKGNPVTKGGARLLLDQFLALPGLSRWAGTE
jgi:predicted NBD/HSP70 family sugar kinase